MKKHIAALLLTLAFASPAAAQTINALGAGAAVQGTDMYPTYQGANPAKRVTAAQINTYIQSLWGAGCATFLTTPSSANLRGCVNDETGTGLAYFQGGALGTPSSGVASNLTGLPISTGLTGAGTGVLAALAVNVGSAGAPVLFNGAGGTPSSLTLTNATGLPLAQLTGAGTGVLAALANAMNSSTGPIGALTPTNSNCVVGNGTAWTSAACPGGGGGTPANPTATAGPTAINGVATTYMRSDAAPAVQQGSSSIKGIVQVDGTTITASSGVISVAPITALPSTQTGTNYAIVDGDRTKVIYLSNAANQTPTLPSAATLTSSNGWFVTACNIGAGTQTVTPTTSTIGGAASLLIPAGSAARPNCYNIISDGTNYSLVPSSGTIFAGTAAMGTSAITAGTCATVVTVSAPGVATTDVVSAGFNGDPTATTGYLPTAMLTLVPYPSANNVNVKACNLTGSSITPSALTLNIKVFR